MSKRVVLMSMTSLPLLCRVFRQAREICSTYVCVSRPRCFQPLLSCRESSRSDGLGSFAQTAQKSSTAATLGSLVKVSSQFFERALERASGS